MRFQFLPREEKFYQLFVDVAVRIEEAAHLLHELLTGKPERAKYCVDQIKRLENEADEITHEVVKRLDRTFITPIDREDIHLLSSDLDDVIDRIDGTARRAQIFRVGPSPTGIGELCDLVEQITAEVHIAVVKLRDKEDVLGHCIKVKRFEEMGDAIYHEMLGKLFDSETDPIRVIKWKEIFDNLEHTIDESEDVANDIESIVLKHQ